MKRAAGVLLVLFVVFGGAVILGAPASPSFALAPGISRPHPCWLDFYDSVLDGNPRPGCPGGGGSSGTDGGDAGEPADPGDGEDGEVAPPPPPPIPAPEAAAALVGTFTPAAIQIGMAPKVNPDWGHRRSYVGLPIWMWVADPSPSTWGVYSYSGSTGGQTIRFEAQVSTVTWSMGDGSTVTCGLGNIYSPSFGNVPSPSCGHKYTQTSKAQPGGMYTVTATSNWVISWTSMTDGSTGTLTTSASTSTQVEILALQSVNT